MGAGDLHVYLTPGGGWRVEVTATRIRIFQRLPDGSLLGSPAHTFRDLPALQRWLTGHGWTWDDLTES